MCQIKAVVAAMKQEVAAKDSDIFSAAEISAICTKLRVTRDASSIIDILRTECFLLLKGSQQYKLMSV